MIPFRTGNLGVAQLKAAWRGAPPPDPEPERAKLVGWKALGFDAVEDYVSWALIEPQRGAFDWSVHRGNAAAAAAAGLDYWIYLWAHVSPRWWRDADVFVPARCLAHRCASHYPSVFAASTWDAIDRFYRAVGKGLGDVAAGVVVGFPADYGEIGMPSGVADWLFVTDGQPDHHHPGLWCDEAPAREQFMDQMRMAYGSAVALGAAWHLAPNLAWTCPYPGIEATDRHRDDFARFYCGAVSSSTERMLELTQRHFPGVPREFKIGHCSESLSLGVDLGALVAVAARRDAIVRSTQSGMSELFTTRLASLCRTHGVPFATESSREIGASAMAQRVFTDLAHGTTSYFEYPEQLRATEKALGLARDALDAGPARRPVACFYPTVAFARSPGLGVLEDLHHCYPWLRRVADVDVVDDAQVAEGALRGLDCLLWMDDVPVDSAALAALEGWVRDGGVLVYAAPTGPIDASTGTAPVALSDEMRNRLDVARTGLRYRHHCPARIRVAPGEESSRLFLGPGWHGRENGAFAWPGPSPDTLVPARWTAGAGELVIPRPAEGPLRLVADLFVPPGTLPAELRVLRAGGPAHVVPLAEDGVCTIEVALDGIGDEDALRIELASRTYRPARGTATIDLRDLGLLVKQIVIEPVEPLPVHDPDLAFTVTIDASDQAAPRALGRGWILPGDGTPLSAAAWLSTWLAGGVPGTATPSVWRDEHGRCFVTTFEGGALLHNPDGRAPHRAHLVDGHGREADVDLDPRGIVWWTAPDA
jgi:hypothetical protein